MGGLIGSCQSIFDSDGRIKSSFSDRVVIPTIRAGGNAGVTLTTIEEYSVARQPQRTSSNDKVGVVPISLSETAIARIRAQGSQFRYQELMLIVYEDGHRDRVDFTTRAAVSADGQTLDLAYTEISNQIQFIVAKITFVSEFFFSNLPGDSTPSRRVLQDLSAQNQDLVQNTPLVSNTTFTATISAQKYDKWAVDTMTVLGSLLRVLVFLLLISATVVMVILNFRGPVNNKIVRIAKFLEFVSSVSWMVKFAFIPALYSVYELVFLDELAKVDTLLMGELIQEREIRSALGSKNKFGEYSIPVLVVNSATGAFAFLVVSVIAIAAAKVVFSIKSKKKEDTESGAQSKASLNKSSQEDQRAKRKTEQTQNSTDIDQKEEEDSPFLDLVKIALSLVIPTILFYSLVGVTWNSMKGNYNYDASMTNFILAIILVGALYLSLLLAWPGYCFSLEKNNKNSKSVVFELWNVWISLLRFALMMTFIVTQQDYRVACLVWVTGTQVGCIFAYGLLSWRKGKMIAIPQLVFEGCLFLLIIVVFLTEVPDNRVEGNFGNSSLVVLISTLIYCCVGVKAAEFWIGLVSEFKKNQEKTVNGIAVRTDQTEGPDLFFGGQKQEKVALNSMNVQNTQK